MAAKEDLHLALCYVARAQHLTKHHLDPSIFELLAEDFDRLIRTLDELAQVELILGETKPGDSHGS